MTSTNANRQAAHLCVCVCVKLALFFFLHAISNGHTIRYILVSKCTINKLFLNNGCLGVLYGLLRISHVYILATLCLCDPESCLSVFVSTQPEADCNYRLQASLMIDHIV